MSSIPKIAFEFHAFGNDVSDNIIIIFNSMVLLHVSKCQRNIQVKYIEWNNRIYDCHCENAPL